MNPRQLDRVSSSGGFWNFFRYVAIWRDIFWRWKNLVKWSDLFFLGNYEALEQMYGEAGTDYIYDSLATRARLRDKQDLCYNEDIYQTIFPPKQPRLSLADAFAGAGKKNKRKLPIEVVFYLKLSIKKYWDLKW